MPPVGSVSCCASSRTAPTASWCRGAGAVFRLAVDGSGALLGGAVPAQQLRLERVAGPTDAMLGYAPIDYGAPAGAPYVADTVRIPTPAGHTLAATVTRPRDARGPLPVVVTITGSGAQDRDEYLPVAGGYRPFRELADTLGRRGIAVLRYDDRGVGGSTGDFASATTADFADDTRAVLAWLRARPDVDPARIALLGHSEGGLIAPMVAARDRQLAAVVLVAGPAQRGATIIAYQQAQAVAGDTTLRSDSARALARGRAAQLVDSAEATNPWLRFFRAYDPLPTIARVRAPLLIVHGATDRQVTVAQADQLAAAARRGGNRRVTVRVFPAHNHLLLPDPSGDPAGYASLPSAALPPAVRGALADWLHAQLVSTRPAEARRKPGA